MFLDIFKPAPPAKPIEDPQRIDSTYRYWRMRILVSTLIGYALFYFVRKNLSFAMPGMEHDLGLTKASLGLFLTLHGILYGVSKFANGILGDRANVRYFMPAGLILSAIMNFGFGMSSTALAFGLFWLANGWFQGMGFPPCARALTHWFAPKERAVKFTIWNTSHSIGAALVFVLCGWLVSLGSSSSSVIASVGGLVAHSWRLVFFVPGVLALLCAFFLLWSLRDTPASLGLPPVEEYAHDKPEKPEGDKESGFGQFVWRYVFGNPLIWVVSIANFFTYTIRYSFVDWGPTFLTETRHVSLPSAGWMLCAYETSGIIGMLVCGWATDRLFARRGARVCFISMCLCCIPVFLFWKLNSHSMLVNTALLCGTGMFIYGPQALIGVIAANLATRRAAATAIGMTGFFGYLSGVLTGWGIGKIVDRWGWNPVFQLFIGAAVIGAALFAIAWNAYRPVDKGASSD